MSRDPRVSDCAPFPSAVTLGEGCSSPPPLARSGPLLQGSQRGLSLPRCQCVVLLLKILPRAEVSFVVPTWAFLGVKGGVSNYMRPQPRIIHIGLQLWGLGPALATASLGSWPPSSRFCLHLHMASPPLSLSLLSLIRTSVVGLKAVPGPIQEELSWRPLT